MKKIIRAVLTAVLTAAALAIAPSDSHARKDALESHGEQTALMKLNLASREAVFSQIMAKSVCFAENGLVPVGAKEQVQQAKLLFDLMLSRLRQGDAGKGLPPEQSPAALAHLAQAEHIWRSFSAAVDGWMSSTGDTGGHIETIYQTNLSLLHETAALSNILRQRYLEQGLITPQLERQLGAMNELLILSQSIGKNYCLYAFHNESGQYTATLQEMWTFEASLSDLVEGSDAQQLPPANSELAAKLEVVRLEFDQIKPVLNFVLSGQPVPEEYHPLVLNQTNRLFTELDKALYLFEAASSAH